MSWKKIFGSGLAATMIAGGALAASGPAATARPGAAAGMHRGVLIFRGAAARASAPRGGTAFALPELSAEMRQGEGATAGVVDRSFAVRPSTTSLRGLAVPRVRAARIAPGRSVTTSFQGINHFDQRFANGGNQFSLEPPDQGMCVGNGFVLESVNDALRVYDTSGNPLTDVTALNPFYGYAPAIDRTTGLSGPFVTDPSCYFDPEQGRFINVVLTLDTDPVSGDFTGPNHLDIAVSKTGDPTGEWNLYSLPVQDDGTDGTPNHNCELGPCIGDYPHIGADRYGFYITTNEYSLFANQYTTAQLYAFSKAALTSGTATVPFVHLDNLNSAPGRPAFTMWPAQSPTGSYATAFNGTEFLLSSMAAPESGNGGAGSNQITEWALLNTHSLDTATPALVLKSKVITSEGYSIPPKANQKAGSVPLAQCLNKNCLKFGFPPTTQTEGPLDANDSRMQQVWYANGQIFGSLDTAVTLDLGFTYQAGIAWFVVNPAGTLANQGYLAVQGNNVTYPAIATRADGTGVIAFTLVGADHYPSAAFAAFDATGPGDVQVAAEGVGPQDGFTEYFIGGGRPRWGDYGSAALDGSDLWVASEYIAQTCSYQVYHRDTTCGGTRSSLANWSTRISQVAP